MVLVVEMGAISGSWSLRGSLTLAVRIISSVLRIPLMGVRLEMPEVRLSFEIRVRLVFCKL